MNHWITVSNINCPTNCVNIYDSLYNYITLQTNKQICSFIRSDQNILQFHMAVWNLKRMVSPVDYMQLLLLLSCAMEVIQYLHFGMSLNLDHTCYSA